MPPAMRLLLLVKLLMVENLLLSHDTFSAVPLLVLGEVGAIP